MEIRPMRPITPFNRKITYSRQRLFSISAIFSSYKLCLLFALSIVLISCEKEQSKTDVEVGVIIPETGPAAFIGESVKQGIILADEKVRQQRDVSFQFLDSTGTPKEGVAAYRKYAQESSQSFVISAITSVSNALVPLVEEDEGVLMATAVSAASFPGQSEHAFRLFIRAEIDARRAAKFSFTELGRRNAGIIHVNDDFGSSFAEVFSNTFDDLGGSIGIRESFEKGNKDVREQIHKILNEKPDLIYLLAYTNTQGHIVRQLREVGYGGDILTIATMSKPQVLEAAGEAAEGVYFTSSLFSPDSSDPKVKEFVQDYQDEFGEKPDYFAAFAYECGAIFINSIDSTDGAPGQVRKALHQNNHKGMLGNINFDQYGDCVFNMIIKKIEKDQNIVQIDEKDPN